MNTVTDVDPVRSALREHFGFGEFRPLQEEIIRGVLAGRDAFVLMPTGGGKSLCFQLPAMLLPGVTVVVSPLIALMKDQVDALVENGIAASFINSTLSSAEVYNRKRKLQAGETKLLYVAPERLIGGEFTGFLEQLDVSLFAIDEAHCISEWGHDFRADYRQLATLRRRFPEVPIVAMTATANTRVQNDIIEQLHLAHDLLRFRASFDRANLFYSMRQKGGGNAQLLDIVERHKGESGIIYCQSRNRTEEMAEFLRDKGYRALPYHAGLEHATRTLNQEKFVRDDVEIICATIAFGMGIDKPDVRYVIHYDLPKNLMGYYQETGRAGRDGLPSDCVLFYSPGDRVKIQRFIDEKTDPHDRAIAMAQLEEMCAYAETGECRHRSILRYFSEEYEAESCGACDNCMNPEAMESYDATRPAQMFLSCVARLREGFGMGYVIDVLRGSNNARVLSNRHSNLPTYGIGKDLAKEEWRSIAHGLLQSGAMVQDSNNYNVLRLTDVAWEILRNNTELTLRRQRKVVIPAARRDASNLPETNAELFERLRALRKTIADQQDVPAYVIFDNKTLLQMAARIPVTPAEFREISGVGQTKAEHYGSIFLREIARFIDENPEMSKADVTTPAYEAPRRTPSAKETLALFREGMTPEQIARSRKLSSNTVTEHLEALVGSGEITEIDRLVDPEKIASIESAFRKCGLEQLRPVLDELGEGYNYNELRIVRARMNAK